MALTPRSSLRRVHLARIGSDDPSRSSVHNLAPSRSPKRWLRHEPTSLAVKLALVLVQPAGTVTPCASSTRDVGLKIMLFDVGIGVAVGVVVGAAVGVGVNVAVGVGVVVPVGIGVGVNVAPGVGDDVCRGDVVGAVFENPDKLPGPAQLVMATVRIASSEIRTDSDDSLQSLSSTFKKSKEISGRFGRWIGAVQKFRPSTG